MTYGATCEIHVIYVHVRHILGSISSTNVKLTNANENSDMYYIHIPYIHILHTHS